MNESDRNILANVLCWLLLAPFLLLALAWLSDYTSHRPRGGLTELERDELRARAALSQGWRRVVDGPGVGR